MFGKDDFCECHDFERTFAVCTVQANWLTVVTGEKLWYLYDPYNPGPIGSVSGGGDVDTHEHASSSFSFSAKSLFRPATAAVPFDSPEALEKGIEQQASTIRTATGKNHQSS